MACIYFLFLKKMLNARHTAANIKPHAAKMYMITTNGTADDRVTSTGEPSGGIPSAKLKVYQLLIHYNCNGC